MAGELDKVRVRLHPLVAAEVVAVFVVLFVAGAVEAVVNDGPTPFWMLGFAIGTALVAVERVTVATEDGLVARDVAGWRRHRVGWEEVRAIRVVEGWRGRRRVEVVLRTGEWFELRAPRDGMFARDPDLADVVEHLWRRIPPAAAPARPMLYVPLHGRLALEAVTLAVAVGLGLAVATRGAWPLLLGVVVAVGAVVRNTATRVAVDDERILEVRGLRRRLWRSPLADVRDVRVTSGSRRIVEVDTDAGVHRLAAPRDGLLVRDPHLEALAADLRSRVPVAPGPAT
jgi:hypothetical protein